MIRHFYVYNNCSFAVLASVSYVPLDEDQRRVVEVEVPPGSQKMLCTTEVPLVVAQAVSKSGLAFWFWQQHTLGDGEYTLVLSETPTSDFPNPDHFSQPNVNIK